MSVGDGVYAVYGPPSSACPLGYAHEKKGKYRCSLKSCKIVQGAGKRQKISKLCVHKHALFCALRKEGKIQDTPSFYSSSNSNTSSSQPCTGHVSSVDANKTRFIPYEIP